MYIIRIVITLILLAVSCVTYADNKVTTLKRIAHAGGAYQGQTYTNSFEALNHNYQLGFEWFEIDFSFTKDTHLVCLHDWQSSFRQRFNFKATEKPSLETFQFLAKYASPLHICTLAELNAWLAQHPKAKLITDVKQDNLRALKIMATSIDDFQTRIIPQCYQPENYTTIKAMGYQQIIWTLYRYGGDNSAILKAVDKMQDLLAVTMPLARSKTLLAQALAQKNILSYVHTVNDNTEFQSLKSDYAVSEIYTDFLSPQNNIPSKIASTSLRQIDNVCLATYSETGELHIPCVLKTNADSNQQRVYEVYLQRQFPEFLFQLDVMNIW